MHLGQHLLPLGLDIDSSPQHIQSDYAFFLKGVETSWQTVGGKGSNGNELKPSESNYLYCSTPLPEGENTVIGYYYHAEGNCGYVVVHNSFGLHFIYRIRGYDGTCQKVFDFCKDSEISHKIVNVPRYYFSKGRIAIKSLCRYLPDGTQELYLEMVLVNGKVPNLTIIVEDSIATNSFSTPFFNPKRSCCGDRCRLIKTGVPTPMQQIKIIPIPVSPTDKNTQNRLFNAVFQFRIREENGWGKVSEYGLISDAYSNDQAGCSNDPATQPSCLWLELNTPCPETVRVTVSVRTCILKQTIGSDGNLFSDWKDAYTIDLYDKTNPALKWYERPYDTSNPDMQFASNFGKVRFKFCNNRECKPVALANIRNENPAPITSGSVASIGNSFAYASNENSLETFPKADIESIKLEVIPRADCKVKYQRVKVWMAFHNIDGGNYNEPVYTVAGITGWGGFGPNKLGGGFPPITIIWTPQAIGDEGGFNEQSGAGQHFPTGIKGCRAILAGTKYTAESKQFLKTSSGITEIGPVNLGVNELRNYVSQQRLDGNVFLQCFDFGLVPQGKYSFRIMAHNDNESDISKLEKTSTFYRETATFSSYVNTPTYSAVGQKEIFIDTTNGQDYDSQIADRIAIVEDVTYPGHNFYCVRGYLYENNKNLLPIELAEVHKSREDNGIVNYSDHNGFYYYKTQYGGDYQLYLLGSRQCSYGQLLGRTSVKQEWGTTLSPNLYAEDRIGTYSKEDCNRWLVKGKIIDCVTGGGISGVAIVMARTAPAYTNKQGEFVVVAHYNNGRTADKLIASAVGGCSVLDCNCNPISIELSISQPSCVNCNQTSIDVGSFSLKTITDKGWPFGYKGQIGMSGEDWLGRITPIQTSEKLFVDIPTEQELGSSFHPTVKVTLPAAFSNFICQNFKNITFWWSKNTNFEDFLEWAADQVQFIDGAGNVNTVNPLKVKIWYRSLNQYNLLRGLNTNTAWTPTDTNGNSRVGDVVEFIQNEDGNYLPPNTGGIIQYDKEGTYFLVDYDDSLKDLKDGVKFKFKRPYVCETAKTFYEYPFPINFCGNCKPKDDEGNVVTEFILDAVSSYNVNRQIPVVKDVITLVDGKDVTTQVKTMRVYPFVFEHHSPSDTWGDHCNNGGRVNYVNPYEGKRCDRTQILLTGALGQSSDGAINYLHYFSLADEFVLDEKGFGAITALLVREDGQVLIICGLTCFTLRFNDDRAVVTEDGYVRLPTNSKFSRPERNPSFNFGCQPDDVNTIGFKDSIAWFLDSQRQAFVLHNFSEAVDVSPRIQSWLVPAIKKVKASTDTMFWHCGYDRRLGKIYLTKFVRGMYTNNELDFVAASETVGYYIEQKRWRQSNFTPEYYGEMDGDKFDSQFFSFRHALAWAHHNAVNPSPVYLNYFGTQCIPVIGVVTNAEGTAEKSFMANEIYCKQRTFPGGLFILERLETSMGQKSRVRSGQWERGGGKSYAPYLCDTANPDACEERQDALFDGDTLYGKWLKALYIPNPVYNGEYFEITEFISWYAPNSNGAQ